MITLDDVRAARTLIAPHVRTTPVSEWAPGVRLKHEYMQLSGTFKARGAFARQLGALASGALDPAVGVVVASGGNAGLAHALVAARLGHRAEVFVPGTASPVKVQRLRAAGATVHQVGSIYADAFDAAQRRVRGSGAIFCHAYDQPQILAGAGTLGLELQEQLGDAARAEVDPGVDTVLVSVGGGGLIGGLLAGLDPRVRVIGVETEGCPTLHAALAAGEPVDVSVGGVAADSLGATRLGELAWELASAASAAGRLSSVVVDDDAVLAAQRALWDGHRVITEPAAATALAALTSGAYRPADGERVAVILCGANTAPGALG